MGTRFTSRNIYASEKHIMKLLNWNVSLLTIMHYVQFFYSTGVAFKSDQIISSKNKKIHIEDVDNLDNFSEKFIK